VGYSPRQIFLATAGMFDSVVDRLVMWVTQLAE